MNLLFIDLHCDALLPSGAGEFGGGNTYSRSVLNLISKNVEINCIYITRKKSDSLPEFLKISENLKFIRIKIGDYSYDDKDTLHLHTKTSVVKILELLEKHKFIPEIIHSSYWPSGLVALEIGNKYKTKQIHTVLSNGKRKAIESGHYKIEQIRTSSEQKIYSNVDFIICSSKAEYEDINSLYSVPEQKLVLSGLDVDDAFRFPSYLRDGSFLTNTLNGSSEKTYLNITNTQNNLINDSRWWNDGAFLYFGRLHEDKGVPQIIECWLELYQKHHNFPSLWIAGGTPEQIFHFREIIQNKKALNLAENQEKLIWWGRLSAEGISTLLLKSIAVITHSRYEAGGLMVLESLASAKPVVATPNGFAKDCVKNWKNGFIVKYNNLNELKLRMCHFYLQPLLSSELGNNALNTFFKIDKEYGFRNKHLELYNVNKANNFDYTNRPVNPYPLCEVIPTESEVVRSLYNIYSKQNIVNYKDICIILLFDKNTHRIWKLNIGDKKFYCIRWKNHYNRENIFYKTKRNFYTSFEQYNLNKSFLNINFKHEKYFDDFLRLIFISENKENLKPLLENIPTVNFSKYIISNRITKYTSENIINEIEDMLNEYDFFFNGCENIISNIVEKQNLRPSSQNNLCLFPKSIENAYVLGNELVFLNDLVLTENEYIHLFNKKYNNSHLSALLKCHELMIKSIIESRLDYISFESLLQSLK